MGRGGQSQRMESDLIENSCPLQEKQSEGETQRQAEPTSHQGPWGIPVRGAQPTAAGLGFPQQQSRPHIQINSTCFHQHPEHDSGHQRRRQNAESTSKVRHTFIFILSENANHMEALYGVAPAD